jgi:hypothetical protein
LCFCVAQGFGPLTEAVGTAAVFWGFGSILVVVFILSAIFVPETKGRSLDEASIPPKRKGFIHN